MFDYALNINFRILMVFLFIRENLQSKLNSKTINPCSNEREGEECKAFKVDIHS